jgi:uncharacterized protein YdaU (DUF1376 family)
MSAPEKPNAWMPLYIGDWDSDTRHLDCEQDGAYGRLVRHYWRNGALPDDDAQLARVVGMALGRWRKVRPVLAVFFTVAEGRWTHRRVEEELARWTDKKRRFIERASAGGRAKAAKSSASSTSKALLKGCTSASAGEVEGPSGHSTLSGQKVFSGPEEVRAAFVGAMGEAWVASYIDPCGWQDVPERALLPATGVAATEIRRACRTLLHELDIVVLGQAA